MKRIVILSLFPNVFNEYFNSSIIKRAIDNNIVNIEIVNFRDFSNDKHKKVDDAPYGGGPGMVLKLQPIVDAIKQYKTKNSKVVLLTPSGQMFSQHYAKKLSLENDLILICGHYEGFDERILHYIDEQLSIGDYILSGGELAAMVVSDALIRLYDGTIKNESVINESFENHLLDYPVYTKPVDFDGLKVPSVLVEGNHKKINEFRLQSQIQKTKINRPDLYQKYKNKGE